MRHPWARLPIVLTAVACTIAVPALATKVLVGPGQAYTRLTDALNAIQAHDTIQLMPATYAEGSLVIDKPMTLLGVDLPLIDGGEQGNVIEITAPNVTVKGVRITGTKVSNMDDNAALKVIESDDVHLVENVLENCFFAIHVAKSRRTVIRGNRILGDPHQIDRRRANGIHLWRCEGVAIEDNISQDHRDGIYLEFVTDSHITGNISQNNTRYGLHFMFSHNDTYAYNHFEGNGAGVAVMFSKFVEMRHNRFVRNRGASSYGLLLKEINNVVVEDNWFEANTTGILVDGCNRAHVEGNEFVANGWAIRLFSNATDVLFQGNAFLGNTFDLSTSGDPRYTGFKRNYWDRYQGYDLDRDGIGDVPYRPLSLFAMVNERMPYAVVLSRSLLTGLLDQAERLIPSLTPVGLEDQEPLMKPPIWNE